MIRTAILLLALASSLACGQDTLRLGYPADWARRTVEQKARFYVAVQSQAIAAFNAAAKLDLAAARTQILPRLLFVSARLAEHRMLMPEAKAQFAVRIDRSAIRKTLTAEELTEARPDSVFVGSATRTEPPDPTEDLTTYTESDANGDLTVTASTVTVDTMRIDVDAAVYRDAGAGHFANFTHLFEFKPTAVTDTNFATCWAVANSLDDITGWYNGSSQTANGFLLWSAGTGWLYYIRDCENQGADQDSAAITVNTQYYATATRSGTSLTVAIYSNAGRTALVDTVACTLASGRTYRYIYAVGASHTTGTQTISYLFGNLDLGEAAATAYFGWPYPILNPMKGGHQ